MHGHPICICRRWFGLRLAQREHRTARVSQNPVDGAASSQVLENRVLCRAQNNQAGIALEGL